MYHTGARVSEAVRLTVADLQLAGRSADRSLATLTGKNGKNVDQIEMLSWTW